MQAFHIRYRNTQGTLMRILNAASRRGLDMPSVQAAPAEQNHRLVLLLDVNQKQVGQLFREWYAISDVIDVHATAGLHAMPADWASPHPPTSAGANGNAARAALA